MWQSHVHFLYTDILSKHTKDQHSNHNATQSAGLAWWRLSCFSSWLFGSRCYWTVFFLTFGKSLTQWIVNATCRSWRVRVLDLKLFTRSTTFERRKCWCAGVPATTGALSRRDTGWLRVDPSPQPSLNWWWMLSCESECGRWRRQALTPRTSTSSLRSYTRTTDWSQHVTPKSCNAFKHVDGFVW